MVDINIDDDEFTHDKIDGDDNKITDKITEDKIDDNKITNKITEDVIDNNEITDKITKDEIPEDEIVEDDNNDNNIDRFIFIDPLINDINRSFISAELYITSGLVYGTSSVPDYQDNDRNDSSEATTEDQTKDDIASTKRKEVDTYESTWTNNFCLTFTSLFKCFSNTDT